MQLADSDLHRVLRRFEIDASRLAADMVQALERLPNTATQIQDFSPQLEQAVERAWVYGSLKYGHSQVRGASLLLGLVKTPSLRTSLDRLSPEFRKINADLLSEQLPLIVAGSPEDGQLASDGSGSEAQGVPGNTAMPSRTQHSASRRL